MGEAGSQWKVLELAEAQPGWGALLMPKPVLCPFYLGYRGLGFPLLNLGRAPSTSSLGPQQRDCHTLPKPGEHGFPGRTGATTSPL